MEGSVFKRRLRVSLPCVLGFPAMSLYFPFGLLCGFHMVSVWPPMVSQRFRHDFPAVSLWFPCRLFGAFLRIPCRLPGVALRSMRFQAVSPWASNGFPAPSPWYSHVSPRHPLSCTAVSMWVPAGSTQDSIRFLTTFPFNVDPFRAQFPFNWDVIFL